MASGKVPPLGCNFARYPCHLTSQRYIQESRSGSGASSKPQNREIPRTDSQIPLRTGSRGDTRPNSTKKVRISCVILGHESKRSHKIVSKNVTYSKEFRWRFKGETLYLSQDVSRRRCRSGTDCFSFVGVLQNWNCWTLITN